MRNSECPLSPLPSVTARAFSRDYERESDYLGLYLTHQAGFDINSAITYWERIGSIAPQFSSNYLSTHPSTPERFVRIQKTIEEIRQGRTLQEVWNGDFSETQVATNNSPRSVVPSVNTASVPSAGYSPTNTPTVPAPRPPAVQEVIAEPPIATAPLTSPLPSIASPRPDQETITKTYASLVQYDGPRIKSGVTLDAQFMDDGSGSGEALVNDVGNRMLRGTFTTVTPGSSDWPRPRILDRATLNKLQILSDRPWFVATLSNADTVLECVFGETHPLGLKKGACRDNYGNRYHLSLVP